MGEREIDGRSDLYSLGVVGYQMLTGELPFTATNTPAMLMKHINQAPRPLRELRPDVPAGLERAIERAMAKKPDQRWPDAAGVSRCARRRYAAAGCSAQRRSRHSPRRPCLTPARGGRSRRRLHRAVRDMAPPRPTRPAPLASAPDGTAVAASSSWPADGSSQPAIPPWMPHSWRDVRKQWRAYNKDQRRHDARPDSRAAAGAGASGRSCRRDSSPGRRCRSSTGSATFRDARRARGHQRGAPRRHQHRSRRRWCRGFWYRPRSCRCRC